LTDKLDSATGPGAGRKSAPPAAGVVSAQLAEALRLVVSNTQAMEALATSSILRPVSDLRLALSGLEPMLQMRVDATSLAKTVSANLGNSIRMPFVQSLAALTSFESLRPAWGLRGLEVPDAGAAVWGMMRGLTASSMAIDLPNFNALTDQLRGFVDRGRDLDERTDVFLRRHGWPLPVSLPSSLYREVVGMAEAPKRDVNRLMTELFAPGTSGFRFLSQGIQSSSLFLSRRQLLRQSFSAAGKGHWYVVINSLLPLVEGALCDAAYEAPAARPRRGVVKAAVEVIRSDEEQAWTSYTVFIRTVEALVLSGGAGVALFDEFNPSAYGGTREPRGLNRHAIAHGLARHYGSRRNSLKLVLLLAALADCLGPIYERRTAT
jgi:hypothetical protein